MLQSRAGLKWPEGDGWPQFALDVRQRKIVRSSLFGFPETKMTRVKLLSAALIAAAFAMPATARERHILPPHVAKGARITPAARYIDGRLCVPAPPVGAFATQPWDHTTPCEPVRSY
jgi:hypothetical protein